MMTSRFQNISQRLSEESCCADGGGGGFVEGCTHFNNPVNCFKTCSEFSRPKHWTTFCCGGPNLCRGKLFLSFQSCDNISRWDVRAGRALTFHQGREGQTMVLLTRFMTSPNPTPVNMKKTLFKKKRTLIINWDASVFSPSGIWTMHSLSKLSRAMFLPSSDSHSAPVSSALLTFTPKNKQQKSFFVP